MAADSPTHYTIKHSRGSDEFYFDKYGRRHNPDGPAVVEVAGEHWRHEYWVDGRRHRADGPAIVESSGYTELWTHGAKREEVPVNHQALRMMYQAGGAKGYIEDYTTKDYTKDYAAPTTRNPRLTYRYPTSAHTTSTRAWWDIYDT